MATPLPPVNAQDARGLLFACQPGCGFCCTASPLVLPHEAGPLGPLVVRGADGTLRIPLRGAACSSLRADKSCGNYATRPGVCHLYPYQVHAGRRVQVAVSLGCPGVAGAAGPHASDAQPMDAGAEDAARRAFAQPGAADMARTAKETFAEFDRRMKEWGVEAPPDRLRAGFLPHLASFARPSMLPTLFAGLASGDLVLAPKPERAVEALFDAEPDGDLSELLAEAAQAAFDEPDTVLWVESDHAWTSLDGRDGRVRLTREKDGVKTHVTIDPRDVPTAWDEDASRVLADYLERLCHRDHTEGAAAWVVDASGYQATPAAAYGRVLAEAALQVVLRAGLFAHEAGVEVVDAALARQGVAAYETSYHSLPTLGCIL